MLPSKDKVYLGQPKNHKHATATCSNILKTLHRPNKTGLLAEGGLSTSSPNPAFLFPRWSHPSSSLHLPCLYPECHIFISDSQIQLPTQHLHLDASNSSQIQCAQNEINDLLTPHSSPIQSWPYSALLCRGGEVEGKVRGDKTNVTEVLLERKIKSFRKSKCKSTEILLLLQIFKKDIWYLNSYRFAIFIFQLFPVYF